jgi:Mlc titration factor MtfA (ptsG expression regulator)
MRLFARLRRSLRLAREARALQRRAIPDPMWRDTLGRYPFLGRLGETDLDALRRLTSLFLASKEFIGAHGFRVTDEVAVAIAAQACLPVLRLGLAGYKSFVGIVVHADQAVARREVMDEHGLVHSYDEVLSGEAMDGGPVMLSWRDVQPEALEESGWAYNVVIHEFAHVLDLADGQANGMPPLVSEAAREHWQAVLIAEYDRFSERVVCGYDTVMDPYGAEGPDEFFAVASESFFVTPREFREEQPELYRLLGSYYLQDPAA